MFWLCNWHCITWRNAIFRGPHEFRWPTNIAHCLGKWVELVRVKEKLDAFQKNIRPGVPLYVTNMNKANLQKPTR
jgi:hypothetical protein